MHEITPAKKPRRRRFSLLVEDAGGKNDVPCMHRLRRFLKTMKRVFQIRCIRIVEEAPARPASRNPDHDAQPS